MIPNPAEFLLHVGMWPLGNMIGSGDRTDLQHLNSIALIDLSLKDFESAGIMTNTANRDAWHCLVSLGDVLNYVCICHCDSWCKYGPMSLPRWMFVVFEVSQFGRFLRMP